VTKRSNRANAQIVILMGASGDLKDLASD